MLDGFRVGGTLEEVGCYADDESAPDLPVSGPLVTDPYFCVFYYCQTKVSRV